MYAVSDVNDDHIYDDIIGANFADPPARVDATISYAIFGRSAAVQATNPLVEIQLPTTARPKSMELSDYNLF